MISGGFRSQGKRLDSVLQYRKFWFVWLFWIVLAVIDISHRFMVVSASGIKSQAIEIKSLDKKVLRLGERSHLAYLRKLNVLDAAPPESAEVITKVGVSLENPADFGVWSHAGIDFKLLAILGAEQKIAVLSRFESGSGNRSVVDVGVGDSLGGFVVTQISSHKLLLKGPLKESTQLELFRSVDLGLPARKRP